MPTTYAHYRFGRDVLERLPENQRSIILRHRDLYDFGVHGPDLLFYYRPLGKNDVNQLGYRSHERTGRDFFTQAIAAARESKDREAALSYLYGVLCHFTLDRECHPYVGRKEQTGVSHSAIEASFDRCLMEKDGLDPVTHRVTKHLIPSDASAQVIARFYPPLDGERVRKAEKSMVFMLNLLVARGLKRRVLLGAMKLAGKPHLGDLFVPLRPNPACADSDEMLCECYEGALKLAGILFSELEAALTGQGDLGPGFDHTFGET